MDTMHHAIFIASCSGENLETGKMRSRFFIIALTLTVTRYGAAGALRRICYIPMWGLGLGVGTLPMCICGDARLDLLPRELSIIIPKQINKIGPRNILSALRSVAGADEPDANVL